MLIWLDPSVLDADLDTNINASHGLDCIVSSAHRGEHLVIGERHVISELQKRTALSSVSRAVLGHIAANYSILTSFSRTLSTRIVASHNKHVAPLKIDANQWGVAIEAIGQIGVSKAVLVTENLNDANLFEHAAMQYKAANKLPGTVALTKLGGGGSTTPDCLKNHAITEKKWVLCISDSDRLHPAQQKDLTALKCESIAATAGSVCGFTDIISREIENIIPLIFFEEAVPATHTYSWERHCNEVIDLTPEAHDYGDLKAGTLLNRIFDYGAGSPQQTFWMKIANKLSGAGLLPPDCLNGGVCANQHNAQPCNCILVSGFGDKILEIVVGKLSNRTPHKSCEMISNDPNQAQWYGIGKQVFEWGCAQPKIRA